MARDSDHRVRIETPVAGTHKIAMTRIEVADMMRSDEPLVIEEMVPVVTAEHRAIPPHDSLVGLEVIDLRMSGMVPIDDRETPSIELAEDLAAVASTTAPAKSENLRVSPGDSTVPLSLSQVEQQAMSAIARVNDAVLSGTIEAPPMPAHKYLDKSTSLGVAPLEPATTVHAPFVIDTPVPRRSPLPRAQPTTPPSNEAASNGYERTATVALAPASGVPRGGPWHAITAVARSLTPARWWRRRKTSRVKPIAR